MSTKYERSYVVKNEHIDFQGIMDGLYYPYYMEDCRHRYVEEVLKFNMKEAAERGINAVLSQYTIQFRRPLKKDDSFSVTCSGHPDKSKKPQFHFRQEILRDGKTIAQALFTATCVSAKGGRGFVPEEITQAVSAAEAIDCEPLKAFL